MRVARELGVNPGTLGNWVAMQRKERRVDEEPLSVPERARLRELERETGNSRCGTSSWESCGLLAQEYR